MDCKNCIYNNKCKHPNQDRPACIMNSRYAKAVKMAGIQKKYRSCNLENLPFKRSNPEAYRKVRKYCDGILHYTDIGYSVYLFSNATTENTMGTGTGKTTCACAILNHFIFAHVWTITVEGEPMNSLPSYFVRCCDFQNKFSIQYKNADAMLEYQSCKDKMKSCRLLVIDDIALRDCSEAFMSELYEVIDYRIGEELSTIYTSNVNRENIDKCLGQRIQSRLYEDCIPIEISGIDNRF